MRSAEKFLSLLFMSMGDKDMKEENAADLLASPGNLSKDAYYLAAQMPIAEMYGKTPEALVDEIAKYTISPEWKSTGQRSILIGDVVCVGHQAYLSLAEQDVLPEFKSAFTLLPGVEADMIEGRYKLGIVKLSAGANEALKEIICPTSWKKA